MNSAETFWKGFCLPAQIFPVVMAGVVLFNVVAGLYAQAVKNTVFALIGTACLAVLCGAGMELLAYVLLALPVVFFLFLLALIVFDQSLLNITHQCEEGIRNDDMSCNSMCQDRGCTN